MAKARSPQDEEDDDFEVIDDKASKSRKKRQPVQDDDDDDQPRNRRRRDDDEDDDDRPRSRRRDDDEDDRPRKKKKKGKRIRARSDESGTNVDNFAEKLIPIMFIATGFIMSFIAAWGMAGKGEAFRAIGLMVVGLLVVIPLIVAALMFGGMLLGIEYGEYKSAIMNLTAIVVFNNGIIWIFEWIGLLVPWLGLAVAFIMTFSLFMMLFDLDPWETQVSIVVINLVLFLTKLALFSMMALKARHEDKRGSYDDDRPSQVQPRDKNRPPIDDPDGDDDP